VRARSLALAVCALATLLAAFAPAYAASRPPARVQVTASEFDFVLSRKSVKSGRVIVQLHNLGEDPHDLAVRRVARKARTFTTREVLPEEHTDLNVRLGPGRYRLWCTIADHRQRGMQAILTVRK
jgi:plastocyanin